MSNQPVCQIAVKVEKTQRGHNTIRNMPRVPDALYQVFRCKRGRFIQWMMQNWTIGSVEHYVSNLTSRVKYGLLLKREVAV